MNIRKLLGLKPRVGDNIIAGMDFGVHFSGVVTEDHSENEDFPYYRADGILTIQNMWKGEIQHEQCGAIIQAGRAVLA